MSLEHWNVQTSLEKTHANTNSTLKTLKYQHFPFRNQFFVQCCTSLVSVGEIVYRKTCQAVSDRYWGCIRAELIISAVNKGEPSHGLLVCCGIWGIWSILQFWGIFSCCIKVTTMQQFTHNKPSNSRQTGQPKWTNLPENCKSAI